MHTVTVRASRCPCASRNRDRAISHHIWLVHMGHKDDPHSQGPLAYIFCSGEKIERDERSQKDES